MFSLVLCENVGQQRAIATVIAAPRMGDEQMKKVND